MKKHIFYIFLLLATAALGACTTAARDNRTAAAYADQIEKSEGVTADEYSEMVSFYCSAMDRALDELRPYHEAHAQALEGTDTARVARTERELTDKTNEVSANRSDVRRLGSHLFVHLADMPDTTRHRLLTYLSDLHSRFSD